MYVWIETYESHSLHCIVTHFIANFQKIWAEFTDRKQIFASLSFSLSIMAKNIMAENEYTKSFKPFLSSVFGQYSLITAYWTTHSVALYHNSGIKLHYVKETRSITHIFSF